MKEEQEFQQAIRDYYKTKYEPEHGPISVQFHQFELTGNNMANIRTTVSSVDKVLARHIATADYINGKVSMKVIDAANLFAEQQ